MSTEPSSIVSLKAFYGDRLHTEDKESLRAELMDGNDRSAIITMAAICDSGLEARIAFALPGLKKAEKKEFNDAFRHDGALGSFSSRISMAFYMGLIDDVTRKQLSDVRHIRNSVAHTSRRVTFDHVQLRNATLRVLHPTGMHKLLNDSSEGYLRSFIAETMLLWLIILHGRKEGIESCRAGYVESGGKAPF
jgi:hypothetical protein